MPYGTTLPFGNVAETFDENGVPHADYVRASTKTFLDEFTWYVEALRARRVGGVPYE